MPVAASYRSVVRASPQWALGLRRSTPTAHQVGRTASSGTATHGAPLVTFHVDPLRAPPLGGLAAVVLGVVLLGGTSVCGRPRD